MRENWNGSERRQANLELHERIVKLESGQDHNKELLENLYKELQNHNKDEENFQSELKAAISSLKMEMTHYKGLVGGITLVISGLFAVVAIAKGWIFGVK